MILDAHECRKVTWLTLSVDKPAQMHRKLAMVDRVRFFAGSVNNPRLTSRARTFDAPLFDKSRGLAGTSMPTASDYQTGPGSGGRCLPFRSPPVPSARYNK